jgi:hypothetical protein
VTFESPSHLTNIPDRLFEGCYLLKTLDLPDSVTRVSGSGFLGSGITSVTSATCVRRGSLFIHGEVILRCFDSPSKITIPSTVREIGEAAFIWVTSLTDLYFEEGIVRISASAFEFCTMPKTLTFPASLEVIGEKAFSECRPLRQIRFASGSHLQRIHRYAFFSVYLHSVILPATAKEIDPYAFDQDVWRSIQFDGPPPVVMIGDFLYSADSRILLKTWSHSPAIIVPSSVVTIGDRCFERCCCMRAIAFEDCSKLKRIGERAFAGSLLYSITIPASTEEIDGSAFVGCSLWAIRIAPGSRKFIVEGNLLLTSDRTEIVRYFGRELELIVRKEVEILGKSCFEENNHVGRVVFEAGSQLRRISRSALSDCSSLRGVSIPASVEVIEEVAFKGCSGLESCLIAENANLATIGREAFSECCSLRSFSVPVSVEGIGENCFHKCISLRRLSFVTHESLNKIVDESTLDEAFEELGLYEISSVLRIDIADEECILTFQDDRWMLMKVLALP